MLNTGNSYCRPRLCQTSDLPLGGLHYFNSNLFSPSSQYMENIIICVCQPSQIPEKMLFQMFTIVWKKKCMSAYEQESQKKIDNDE